MATTAERQFVDHDLMHEPRGHANGSALNQETQRIPVRIAVAVDGNGFWSAAGHSAYESAEETMEAALDYLPQDSESPRRVVWVDAEVRLPAMEVVQGVVGTASNA